MPSNKEVLLKTLLLTFLVLMLITYFYIWDYKKRLTGVKLNKNRNAIKHIFYKMCF